MEALLEFHSVSKTFSGKTVLDNFSLSLKKGEVIAILGPSGCGKTTILNIAAGLVKHTLGKVAAHTNRFGYVFQEPRLIPWKTVLDNVHFVMGKRDEKEMKEKAMEVLSKVGLKQVSHFYPKQLSGGMKQRVSIARALASDPQIILMDEPFSALDVSLKREMQEDVARLIAEKDIGVLYVTHDAEEAARLADRVLLFSKDCTSFTKEIRLSTLRENRNDDDIQQMKKQLNSCLIGG